MLWRHFAVATLLCPSLFVAAVPLGPARPLTPPAPVVAAGNQRDAQVATSGRETLVGWSEGFPGRIGIYVAAVAADGTLIEGTQRRLANDGERMRLSWNGQSYVALWSSGSTLSAMTIDGERRTLTPPHVIRPQFSPLTSNVVWIGDRGAVATGRTLLFLDREGNIVSSVADYGPGGPVLSTRLATDGQSVFVFWEATLDQETTIFVRRYRPDGTPREAVPAIASQTFSIDEEWGVAYGGNRLALAVAERGDDQWTMHRFLVDPATLQSTPLPQIAIAPYNGPIVAWAGDRFVALWMQLQEGATFSRVSAHAEVEQTQTYTIRTLAFTENADSPIVNTPPRTGHATDPAMVWNGTNLIVAFMLRPHPHTGTDVYSGAADWRAPMNTRSAVSLSAQWQILAAAAVRGREALVAWTEGFPGFDLMRVAVTRTTAGIADTPTVYLSNSALPVRPVVVYTGSIYLVLWLELPDGPTPSIRMQRVTPAGTVLDAQPSALPLGGFGVTASSNGTHTIVASVNRFGTLHAIRFTSDGLAVDTTPIALASGATGPPLLASNGSDFLAVWPKGADGEFPLPDRLDIWATPVTSAGTAGGSFPIAVGRLNQRDFSVASDGRDYLIAFTEDNERVVTKKVLREGALAGTTADAPGRLVAVSVVREQTTIAATDAGYAIAWEETGNTFATRAHLAHVDRDGTVLGAPALLAESEVFGMTPAIATAAGRGVLLYAMLQDDAAYGATMRMFIRTIGEARPRGRAVRH